MSITSGERHDLHTRLSEVLGENQANTLMEHLPPVGWADVATKRDLNGVEIALRSDLDALGTQLRTEMAALGIELRGEIATLGTELRSEISTLGTELRSEMTTLGVGLGSKIDVESVNRRADMDALMTRVLHEQRVFLTAIFLAISTLVAVTSIFG